MHKAPPPPLDLALRYDATALLSAGAARAAAELGARHGKAIPPQEVDETVRKFAGWLRSACEVAGAVPTAVAQDEADA